MPKDVFDKIVDWTQGILIGLSIFIGVVIFGWQIYQWLRFGYWISVPLVDAFEYAGIDLTFVYYPTVWHGVAKVTRWFLAWPLSISLPLITLILTWILKLLVQYGSSRH